MARSPAIGSTALPLASVGQVRAIAAPDIGRPASHRGLPQSCRSGHPVPLDLWVDSASVYPRSPVDQMPEPGDLISAFSRQSGRWFRMSSPPATGEPMSAAAGMEGRFGRTAGGAAGTSRPAGNTRRG